MNRSARLLFAVCVLTACTSLANAANVHWPDRMCTNGFGEPAYLIPTSTGYFLHIGSGVETLERIMSVGTGVNGVIYQSDRMPETEAMLDADIVMSNLTGEEDKATILIFRDRVFWPCDDFTFVQD